MKICLKDLICLLFLCAAGFKSNGQINFPCTNEVPVKVNKSFLYLDALGEDFQVKDSSGNFLLGSFGEGRPVYIAEKRHSLYILWEVRDYSGLFFKGKINTAFRMPGRKDPLIRVDWEDYEGGSMMKDEFGGIQIWNRSGTLCLLDAITHCHYEYWDKTTMWETPGADPEDFHHTSHWNASLSLSGNTLTVYSNNSCGKANMPVDVESTCRDKVIKLKPGKYTWTAYGWK